MLDTHAVPYDDDRELTRYVWHNFRHLLTNKERLVDQAVIAREKAEYASSPESKRLLRTELGRIDDAEVNSALAEGIPAFRHKVRERMLVDHRSDVFINRCPNCSRILRTPKAQQCLWCGRDWHRSTHKHCPDR